MKMKNESFLPVSFALLAATLFGLNAPVAKLLLVNIPPMYMVSFLYLGAGIGIWGIWLFTREKNTEAPLTRRELPWTILMILLDVLAPFLLMWGLLRTTAENASLLFNFEMVATSIIALVFFKEAIGRRMWLAIILITIASVIISIDFSSAGAFDFSVGSLLVIAACCCWGLENNCTRNMSAKNPAQIVILKGFGSGFAGLLIASMTERFLNFNWRYVLVAMLLGFVAYGLSIYFYVKAQRYLGATRTSTFYAAAPFIGVLLSFVIFRDIPPAAFWLGGILMTTGAFIAVYEKHAHRHKHENQIHEHRHSHDDNHHNHVHGHAVACHHSHEHEHGTIEHEHPHTPDIHHRHNH